MEKPRPFNGRVIFDHLAEDRRRGDQIVAREFAGKLGTRCVSPHLNVEHRALICRYGGIYSVIAAHVAFCGDGLDHFTCFREPIDRALSWLFFAIGSLDKSRLGPVWHQAKLAGLSVGRFPNPVWELVIISLAAPSQDQLWPRPPTGCSTVIWPFET
jgi:hypothetical protein